MIASFTYLFSVIRRLVDISSLLTERSSMDAHHSLATAMVLLAVFIAWSYLSYAAKKLDSYLVVPVVYVVIYVMLLSSVFVMMIQATVLHLVLGQPLGATP